MNPVYLDTHIHTSENPDAPNDTYDLELLIKRIKEFNGNSEFLISITDHNFINKAVYLKAVELGINIILGVELHIRNYKGCPAYHCHIYFDCEITEEKIDLLNSLLDRLYPKKVVAKKDESIPTIEEIINQFDDYEFMLLPHGGQSHATFDKSIPADVKFDSTLERSIYYNQFEGFTARGDAGLERTQQYFERLGINEFVNLITCSDNYHPDKYPFGKDANPFKPTWMLARPTFNGLRLSLSESTRLIYSDTKPDFWCEKIDFVRLSKPNIEIDVTLSYGLNVIIGGSSSGKTLLVDSIVRKLSGNFDDSDYLKEYSVDKIEVGNPSGMKPHYLSQNYIMSVVNNITDDNIDSIDIIKNIFPDDESNKERINKGLRSFRKDLQELIKCVISLEEEEEKLERIPVLSRLVVLENVSKNIFKPLSPNKSEEQALDIKEHEINEYIEQLQELDAKLTVYPLVNHSPSHITELINELEEVLMNIQTENKIRKVIKNRIKEYDKELVNLNTELQTKSQKFNELLESLERYISAYNGFYKVLGKLENYSISINSEIVESMGHKLHITNDFTLNKKKFIEVLNNFIKQNIDDSGKVLPELLFERNFKKQKPKVRNYEDLEQKVYSKFEELNQKKYQIITNDERDFSNLSPGWKTSVLLDIILGHTDDLSPIIIDQPEDNLATNYINSGLVNAIKEIKTRKQVILVSHNATIPMLADAQNVILCNNVNGDKIVIKSSPLEGKIDDIEVVAHIADITDGGKPSIKKRVKKYNLKKFN